MDHVRAPLQAEELKALHRLSAARQSGPAMISPDHQSKFLGCGYATLASGDIAITPVGRAKLVYETTRADWFHAST